MSDEINESQETEQDVSTEPSESKESNDEMDIDALYKSITGEDAEDETSSDPKGEDIEQSDKVKDTKEPVDDKNLFELKRGDEIKKVPLDKMRDLAQQGYDYNIKMADLKAERVEIETLRSQVDQKREELDSQFGELAKIQEYAIQNPQWLNFIKQQYEQVAGDVSNNFSYDPNNPMTPIVQQLQSKLNKFEERFKQEDEIKASRAEADKDVKLEKEILEYKEKNNHFNWSQEDLYGKNLEAQILNHAIENGIKSFRAAANDFLFDQHMKLTKAQAKEKTAKELQTANRLGIKGISSQSSKNVKGPENIRNRTYEDLINEGLKEFGIE